jgi:flagellar hook-length control protein FliK
VQTPVTAQPGDTVVPLDESLLKAARTAPQRPPEAKPEQAARTAPPAEATAAIRQQAAGLTKAVGDGGRTHVSVNVAKEADTPASQPSVTLAAAAAPLVDGARPNQRPHAKAAQADAGPGGPLHPTAARAQPQTARGQQTPPTLPPRPGAAAQAPSAGAFTTTVAGSPVASTETGEDDLIGLAGTTDNPRGTGPVTARTNGGGKLSAHHRSVVDQISVNVGKAVKAGIDRIEIRLRPENLGRVEVRLEVHHDGRVTAAVTADNRDTLELLKSDARGLERALQDAGLKADSGSLSFSLRGHDTAARHGGGSIPNPPAAEIGDGVAEDGDDPSASRNTAYPQGGILPDGRIDIRA